jgi:hypothetical protein
LHISTSKIYFMNRETVACSNGYTPLQGGRRTVRTRGGAAVGVVSEGVDVEAALGVRVVALDVVGDLGRRGLRLLLEDDGARHLGVTTEDSN